MPKVIFKYLWENLKNADDVVAYVKNLCKNGDYYWVLATVKTAKNPDGTFRNHMSTRRCITDNAKEVISKLYDDLLHVEISEGVEKSQEIFESFLIQKNIKSVEEFNIFMQNLNK